MISLLTIGQQAMDPINQLSLPIGQLRWHHEIKNEEERKYYPQFFERIFAIFALTASQVHKCSEQSLKLAVKMNT